MKLSSARRAIYICTAFAILFGIIAAITMSWIWFMLLGLAFLAELIFFYGFLRCPYCGKWLDRAGMHTDITHCPFCGKELEDGASNNGRP